MGPQHLAKDTIYMGFNKFIYHSLYIYVWDLIIHIVLFEVENKNILILDIGGQNTSYVSASKGTHTSYLNLNLI